MFLSFPVFPSWRLSRSAQIYNWVQGGTRYIGNGTSPSHAHTHNPTFTYHPFSLFKATHNLSVHMNLLNLLRGKLMSYYNAQQYNHLLTMRHDTGNFGPTLNESFTQAPPVFILSWTKPSCFILCVYIYIYTYISYILNILDNLSGSEYYLLLNIFTSITPPKIRGIFLGVGGWGVSLGLEWGGRERLMLYTGRGVNSL